MLKEKVAFLVAASIGLRTDLPAIQEMLKDQSIPLEDRWSAYTDLVTNHILVNEASLADGFISTLGPNMTLYDDFNIDRYCSSTFPEMYDTIMDAEEDELFAVQTTTLPAWQEQVLQSGLSGFEYDW